jgi:peptidoglycan/xylan/chitin deacetylase (PgdA/CDA1 family)
MSRAEKKIYLTFDDGPTPGVTEWVLEQLKAYNAKATFFCIGSSVSEYQALFQKIRTEGHSVGNHSMRHKKGFRTQASEYLNDALQARELVNNDLYRPPYGQLTPGQYRGLHRLQFRIVMWDVISYDYSVISPQECIDNVTAHARNGSIVLFHDSLKAEKNLRVALPAVLSALASQDYTFEKLV